MDLKSVNIVFGKQNHKSKFPCVWCYGTAPYVVPAMLTTMKSLRENYKKFRAYADPYGEKKAYANAQLFYGVVNEPLLEGDEDLELIFWVFIPGLHVFLGIVNTVFDYLYRLMIEGVENGEFHASVYEWALSQNIVGLDYRGGQLDDQMQTDC